MTYTSLPARMKIQRRSFAQLQPRISSHKDTLMESYKISRLYFKNCTSPMINSFGLPMKKCIGRERKRCGKGSWTRGISKSAHIKGSTVLDMKHLSQKRSS